MLKRKPNVFSATRDIAACRKRGDFASTVQIYRSFLAAGNAPDAPLLRAFLAAALKAKTAHGPQHGPHALHSHRALIEAIHANLGTWRVAVEPVLGCSLLDALWKCGSPDRAHSLFDDMKRRGLANGNVFVYTAMLCGLARAGKIEQAMELLNEGSAHKLPWNGRCFSALLVACGKKGDFAMGKRVHQMAVQHNAAIGVEYLNALLDMYARCGQLKQAQAVFDDMKQRGLADVVSYNAMVAGFARAGKLEQALELLNEGAGHKLALKLDSRSFSPLLATCGKKGDLATGKRVHQMAVEHNAAHEVEYLTSLLSMYAGCAQLDEAMAIFEDLKRRGLADAAAYTAAINALARAGKIEHAMKLLDESTTAGLALSSNGFSALLSACGEKGDFASGQRVHQIAMQHNAANGAEYLTSLLSMYAGCGKLKKAESLFEDMKRRGLADVVAYTAMISGLARADHVPKAVAVLDEGNARGLRYDAAPFCALLVACGRTGALATGERVYQMAVDHKVEQGREFLGSVLTMFAHRGVFDKGLAVFEDMKRRGLVDAAAYNSLIDGSTLVSCRASRSYFVCKTGYGTARQPEKAFAMFEQMKQVCCCVCWLSFISSYCVQAGVAPTDRTFASLISACAHGVYHVLCIQSTTEPKCCAGGLVSKAHEFMAELGAMGLQPLISEYCHAAMVDVLCRAGRLQEAEDYMLAYAPHDIVAHTTLLAACRQSKADVDSTRSGSIASDRTSFFRDRGQLDI